MSVGQTNPLRQQMINMMYLVLTALLALNVSADILKAFALVNNSLTNTNEAYKNRNDITMEQFKKLHADDPERAKIVYENAQKIQKLSDETYQYLESLKDTFAAMSGGWVDDGHTTVLNDADLEVGTNYMVNKKHANELREKLTKFHTEIVSYLTDANGNPTPNAVNIDNTSIIDPPKDKEGTKKSWAEYYFEGVPAIAAITEVTKFQNEIRNTEGEAIQYLFKQVGANTIKIDSYIPVVSTNTPAVFSGDPFMADISLGAISNTQQFTASVNGTPVEVVGGKAHYEVKTSGIGEKPLNVVIKYKDAKGEEQTLTQTVKYNVFTGSATIAATKMNMLYIGLDNPISVSVPGFRPDQVNVSATPGLNLKKVSNTEYLAKPSQGTREGTVTVTADGKKMGSMSFRIRPVPKPEVLFGTKTGGAISRGEIMTVNYVNAGLGAGFAFEGLNYKVLKYTLVFAPQRGQTVFRSVTGNTVPGELKTLLQGAHPGDMIIITEVTAQGPPGTVTINGPSLTVK